MVEGRHTRRKNGRMVATSEPQRDRTEATSPPPRAVHLATPGQRLAFALVMQPAARADERAGRTPEVSERALRAQIERARESLYKTPEGRTFAAVIASTLAGPASELAELPTRSCLELRPFAADAAVRLVALIERHSPKNPETLEALGEYVLAMAVTKAARARLFGVGLGVLSATRTGVTVEEGVKLTSKLAAGGDCASLARLHSAEARIWYATFEDRLARERKDTGAPSPSADAERDAVIVAERERRAAHAAARAAAEPEPTHEDDQEHDDQEHPAEEQDAGHPLVGPTPTPPSLDALNRAPRPGQHAHRPTPTAVPEVPRAPVLAWLPVELHPWAVKFSNLEPLAPIQRVQGACGIVGSLQTAGAFARDEARIVGAVQKWRALYMATGVLPTVEGGST